MATTDSGVCEKVDAMRRNGWSACSGMSGQHPSESMVGMARIMHKPTEKYKAFLLGISPMATTFLPVISCLGVTSMAAQNALQV